MTTDNRIRRTFREITSSTKSELPEQLLMYEDGWYGSIAWDEILKSERVLVSAEAGAGKTYECTAQAAALIAAGEPAFYLELTQLASSTVRNLLSPDEARRFDEWETSQTQVATFFLDSIDELRLTTGAFRQAIINVARSLDGRLQRSRIVITTRPIPFDRTVIEKYLPAAQADEVSEEVGDFVDVVTSVRQGVPKKSPHAPMRHVVLLPLTNENISTLAATLGVSEPEQLLSALHEADTLYYARRPQDLIDICSLWRERGRLGSHREQIDTDVRVKLRARNDRAEAAQISDQRAHDAATRLALTMSLTRRLNLRHSAAADIDGAAGTALDPAEVLWDWTQEERQTLLERAFFSFASYGRVRVHHRSVLAYCAALRILTRIGDGASFRSVRRLLFTRTYDGREAIRPSLREPAVWAAQAHSHLCEHVLKCEPYALLSLGDPAQLPLGTIVAAFTAYVDQYGPQRNTGKRLTDTEIRRFASAALAKPILDAWARPILNPEIRIVILAVIDIGRISECADILVSVANDGRRESSERLVAVRAMKGLCDAQLVSMSDQISTDAAAWPYDLAVAAARDLFPRYI